jgi:hypothetical protein
MRHGEKNSAEHLALDAKNSCSRCVSSSCGAFVLSEEQKSFQNLIFLTSSEKILINKGQESDNESKYPAKDGAASMVLQQRTASYAITDANNPLLFEVTELLIDISALMMPVDPFLALPETQLLPVHELPGGSQALGSIKGRLAYTQADGRYFYIHPVLGGSVKCRFGHDLRPVVVQANKKMVEASGLLHYQEDEFLPFEMDVEQINVMPSDADLPTLSSLAGMAPDSTKSASSVEFVRNLRNGWH